MVALFYPKFNFDAEGFMIDKSQWTKEIAVEIARQEGIESLTEAHWKIIDFCRQTGEQTGKSPTLRQITDGTGISTKELVRALPQRSCQESRQDRRSRQARRLCVNL